MRTLSLTLLIGCSDPASPGKGDLVGGDTQVSGESGTPADSSAESRPPDSAPDSAPDSPADTSEDSAATDSHATDTGGDSAPTDDTGGSDTGAPLSDLERCFSDFLSDTAASPDYEPYGPTINSECYGTDHQDIAGIQRVVFVGDSITVGSPPTDPNDFYRSLLAEELAGRYALEAPEWSWEWYNAFDGTALVANSGDFWSCAKWGARTDDLMRDNDQILDCFPTEDWDKTTLVVMTMGGNDLFNLVEGYSEGKTTDELWEQTYEMAELKREAVTYLKTAYEAGAWGAEVYVIFANIYEFTDGTGDVTSCPAAGLVGLGEALTDPEFQEMVVWMQEEYMSIAVDTGSDLIFLLETFCGHGYARDTPESRCDRGDDAELYFDLTCIHPNEAGHAAIAEMFESVVSE